MGSTILRRAAGIFALAAITLTTGLAHADGNQDAEHLFREGVVLRDAGDFAAACPKFAASFALDPAPGTLVNLGDCEVRIGKLIAAIEHYKLAGAGFPKGDKRRDLVGQKVTEIEPKIAHLTIRVAPGVPDTARITRGAAPFDRAESGVAVNVDPGALAVVVHVAKRQDATYNVVLGEGESKEVAVDVGAAEVVTPPSTNPPASAGTGSKSSLRTAGFIVGGAGIVSLGVGAVAGIVAAQKAATVRDHCDTTTYACDSQGVDAAHSGNTLATLSTVTLIAGGALLAGGATMFFIGGKKKETSVAIAPWVGPMGSSVMLSGRF